MTTTGVKPPPVSRRTRTFEAAVSTVVGVHLVLWAVVMLGGWLYWDDFILQGQAARLGLSTELLFNNHDGHVMPLTYAVVWLTQEVGGLDYGLVAGSMLVGEIVLVIAAVSAFTTLLGRGVATVVALSVFLLSPIMLPGLTWWSAALTLVPLMSCALFATVSHVRYLKNGSPAALITTFALVITALGFFEKSILIPVWLFLVTVLVDDAPGFIAAARASLSARWRLWLGWLAVWIVYLIGFSQVSAGRARMPSGPGQLLELLSRALFNTIGPGLVGGPVRWTPVDFSAAFADPPPWVIGLGVLVGAGAVVLGTRRPGAARKAWLAAGVYLTLDLTAFAVGRLGAAGDPAVVQAGRYVATAMIGISVALGATVAAELHVLREARLRVPLLLGIGLVGFLTLISSLSYAAIWSKNPAEIWVGNARADLAANDPGSPLLDQDVPDFLLLPVTNPYNQASWFLAPLRQQPGFSTTTDNLRMLDNRGRLVPATVDGAAGLPDPDGCYQVPAGGALTIPLEHPLIPWLHTVALRYTAQTTGFINVSIGSGQPVAAEVLTGPHSAFVRAEGGESTITVSSTDAALCIDNVQVGKVVPIDLPYGGRTDITDQLQDLS